METSNSHANKVMPEVLCLENPWGSLLIISQRALRRNEHIQLSVNLITDCRGAIFFTYQPLRRCCETSFSKDLEGEIAVAYSVLVQREIFCTGVVLGHLSEEQCFCHAISKEGLPHSSPIATCKENQSSDVRPWKAVTPPAGGG